MDYGSAFASILQDWILFVLQHMGVPDWLLNFIRHMMSIGSTTILFKGQRYDQIQMKCGVRQGCPASSSLFILAIDPIIRWLIARILRPGDELRVFADDKGFAIEHLLKTLPILSRAFRAIALTTGLALNIKKCVIVITGNLSPDFITKMDK